MFPGLVGQTILLTASCCQALDLSTELAHDKQQRVNITNKK